MLLKKDLRNILLGWVSGFAIVCLGYIRTKCFTRCGVNFRTRRINSLIVSNKSLSLTGDCLNPDIQLPGLTSFELISEWFPNSAKQRVLKICAIAVTSRLSWPRLLSRIRMINFDSETKYLSKSVGEKSPKNCHSSFDERTSTIIWKVWEKDYIK